jgi:hypothetical protein
MLHSNHERFIWFSRLLPWYIRPVQSSSAADNDGILFLTLRDRWSNIESELTDIVTDVAIAVAFGALFPPIAVIGLSSIVVRTGFMQFFFGRLASLSAESGKNTGKTHNIDTDKDQDLDEGGGPDNTESTLQQMEKKVNRECAMAGRFVYESLMSLPLLILIVWSLFLFDIAGDEVGFFQAIWIVFVLGLVGIGWSFLNRNLISSSRDSDAMDSNSLAIQSMETSSINGIELREGSLASFSSRNDEGKNSSQNNMAISANPLHS